MLLIPRLGVRCNDALSIRAVGLQFQRLGDCKQECEGICCKVFLALVYLRNLLRTPQCFPYYMQVDLQQPSEHCKEGKVHRCLLHQSAETSLFWVL